MVVQALSCWVWGRTITCLGGWYAYFHWCHWKVRRRQGVRRGCMCKREVRGGGEWCQWRFPHCFCASAMCVCWCVVLLVLFVIFWMSSMVAWVMNGEALLCSQRRGFLSFSFCRDVTWRVYCQLLSLLLKASSWAVFRCWRVFLPLCYICMVEVWLKWTKQKRKKKEKKTKTPEELPPWDTSFYKKSPPLSLDPHTWLGRLSRLGKRKKKKKQNRLGPSLCAGIHTTTYLAGKPNGARKPLKECSTPL